MNHFIKKLLAVFFATFIYSATAYAHDGGGILATRASATHYYQITCGAGSAYLYLEVKGKGKSTTPIISAQISKNTIAKSTTDPKNTDKLASQGMQINEGDGTYHVTFAKSKVGLAKYSFQYHCKSGGNEHTDTAIQNIELKN